MHLKELFKINININYGESSLISTDKFKALNPLLQCDILKDLIIDLEREYKASKHQLVYALKNEEKNKNTIKKNP